MNFRYISAWSIRNPIVPITSMFVGLTIAGLSRPLHDMEVQDNPDIEFPAAIITISQPGAAPTEIENQITQRVEFGDPFDQRVVSIFSSTAYRGELEPHICSSSSSVSTSTRRSTRSRTRSTSGAGNCPTAFSSRR